MTFDNANLNGSENFQPVPSGSSLWSQGDGQTVKQPPKKSGKGGKGGGTGTATATGTATGTGAAVTTAVPSR